MINANRKRKWIKRSIVAFLLVGISFTAALNWETWLRALTYHTPVKYDEPFGLAITGADRIVVRVDGFDCCGPVDENSILFTVTSPKEIAELEENIRFVPRITSDSFAETCMCCGSPGIDWYKGKKRIAFTAIQHGHAIRWRGFSTMRILGFRVGYGDGPLTEESQTWLRQWLSSHGVGNDDSANHRRLRTLVPRVRSA